MVDAAGNAISAINDEATTAQTCSDFFPSLTSKMTIVDLSGPSVYRDVCFDGIGCGPHIIVHYLGNTSQCFPPGPPPRTGCHAYVVVTYQRECNVQGMSPGPDRGSNFNSDGVLTTCADAVLSRRSFYFESGPSGTPVRCGRFGAPCDTFFGRLQNNMTIVDLTAPSVHYLGGQGFTCVPPGPPPGTGCHAYAVTWYERACDISTLRPGPGQDDQFTDSGVLKNCEDAAVGTRLYYLKAAEDGRPLPCRPSSCIASFGPLSKRMTIVQWFLRSGPPINAPPFKVIYSGDGECDVSNIQCGAPSKIIITTYTDQCQALPTPSSSLSEAFNFFDLTRESGVLANCRNFVKTRKEVAAPGCSGPTGRSRKVTKKGRSQRR